MAVGRCVRRPGFNNLEGALNPKTTVSTVAPLKPKRYDIWISTLENKKYYWSGSWILVT